MPISSATKSARRGSARLSTKAPDGPLKRTRWRHLESAQPLGADPPGVRSTESVRTSRRVGEDAMLKGAHGLGDRTAPRSIARPGTQRPRARRREVHLQHVGGEAAHRCHLGLPLPHFHPRRHRRAPGGRERSSCEAAPRRPGARRSPSTLSARPRGPTKQMGRSRPGPRRSRTVQLRGGPRRLGARRSPSTLSARAEGPTKQMGRSRPGLQEVENGPAARRPPKAGREA